MTVHLVGKILENDDGEYYLVTGVEPNRRINDIMKEIYENNETVSIMSFTNYRG